MLYNKNLSETLSPELFANPTCEYRATPFWAWNCQLNRELLDREIDYMKEMGFGGFHMHVRVGMSTKYLSDDFMSLVCGCVDKARSNQMLAWLYDEDKWPSGFAGGYVTKKVENREKQLFFTKTPIEKNKSNPASRIENYTLLARYSVQLGADGCLTSYKRLTDGENGDNLWLAYIGSCKPTPWHNNQTYVDTLSKKAIGEFVEITHERYKEVVGDEFGKLIPAIFTDEPQFMRKQAMSTAFSGEDTVLPFTTDFPDTYKETYGEDILDKLPELFWELPEGVSLSRYRYHDHVSERFAEAFADTIGNWCGKNGIMLTGHMMEEPTLQSQTAALGDCMRSYRSFQLPGIDMLCDRRELTTAKQAQSATHQYGRPGVLSELYGVTNWNFDFIGHKLQGDWQAALGVSVRVPHLYWVSMQGEAKRDYPASIGHQSPWYKEYSYVEDHFARVNTAMTRGKPLVRVGVIHPVESYWLHWGPKEQTADVRAEMDKQFSEITDWLLYSFIDFDFICEALLPSQYSETDEGFAVGEMKYDAVIVPNCETLRSSTLELLKRFRSHGGRVIFAGSLPKYVDALPSCEVKAFAEECEISGWKKTEIVSMLEPSRFVDIRNSNGMRADNLITQLRRDGDSLRLFIVHVNRREDDYCDRGRSLTVKVEGEYEPIIMNTLTGKISACPAKYENNCTLIEWKAFCHDSLLLELKPGRSTADELSEKNYTFLSELPHKVHVTLTEPNVFLLDTAEWSLDGSSFRDEEEMLRICDAAKAECGYGSDISRGAQPWCYTGETREEHIIALKFTIFSDVDANAVSLAAEEIEKCFFILNGKEVKVVADGYYADEAIKTFTLGDIRKGRNELIVSRPFGKLSTIENIFLLGNFGVEVSGRDKKIIAPVTELCFGNWVNQGLPFYGGNVIYHCDADFNGCTALLAPHSRQPLLSVDVSGERKGVIAFAPFVLDLGEMHGIHRLDITAYGNRVNTFGEQHNSNFTEKWFGPGAWRSSGNCWSYEYRLWESGITVTPQLIKY